MKLYKCNYCGRVFDKQLPHKCNHGFRKHKHSWTEIDDSDNEYQKVEKATIEEHNLIDFRSVLEFTTSMEANIKEYYRFTEWLFFVLRGEKDRQSIEFDDFQIPLARPIINELKRHELVNSN